MRLTLALLLAACNVFTLTLAVSVLSNPSVENRILRDLQKSRYLCAQPSFALELCKRTHRAHQQKQCTPTYVEVLKCTVKMCVASASFVCADFCRVLLHDTFSPNFYPRPLQTLPFSPLSLQCACRRPNLPPAVHVLIDVSPRR